MMNRRLQNELDSQMENPSEHYSFGPLSDDTRSGKWMATIQGPEGTPYEGGVFFLDVEVPTDYPHKPPKITFNTKVYHMNIRTDGRLCMDLLRQGWTPKTTIAQLLEAISVMLSEPSTEKPLNWDIANVYQCDKVEHDNTARKWTERYAT